MRSLLILGAVVYFWAASIYAAQTPAPIPPPGAATRTNRNLATRPGAMPNLPPGPAQPGFKPGPMPGTPPQGARTNASLLRPGAKTNAVAVAQKPGLKSRLLETFRHWRASRAFYPVLALVALVLGALFSFKFIKAKPKTVEPDTSGELPLRAAVKLPRSARRKVAIQSCNVFQSGPGEGRLWQFDARGGGFALAREQATSAGEALPSNVVAKDWTTLWRRKLNVAWLPPENVFLRVANFPRSDFDETVSMVELQLEKLSPMPVAQVVWSVQLLPNSDPNLQTVVVVIAARGAVEEFLGRLEGQGFLADRLEVPMLDQLQTSPANEDGAWIYPGAAGGHTTALVAWWTKGVLQNLALVTVATGNRAGSLKEQLLQMAWAGELEGWLVSRPRWHLVADGATAVEWEPALREGLEEPVQVSAPPAAAQLAALTARRAAQAEPRVNLLPVEFTVRYHQQFVDRLWMRGLLGVAMLYLVGLVVYAIALGVATYRTRIVEQQVAAIAPAYTNAVQLKARYEVLKDRQELKYAALNCYKTVAEKLPEGATLESLNLSDGKRLTLNGTAPSDMVNRLLDFESQMRKAKDPEGELLFDPKQIENLNWRQATVPTTVTWVLALDLKRTESE